MNLIADVIAVPIEKSTEAQHHRTGVWPLMRHLRLMALACLAFVAVHAVVTPTHVAVGDSQQYLALAQTLADHGILAYSVNDVGTGALAPREPLYPALLAGLLRIEAALNAITPSCSQTLGAGCEGAAPILSSLNAILFALAALAMAGAVLTLGGPTWGAWLAFGYILLNFEAAHEIRWVMSDYLAMALAAGFALSAAFAIRWRRATAWILPGVALGLLTLTKVAFVYLGLSGIVVLVAGGTLALLRFGTWRPLAVALALAVGFLPPIAGWTIRNGIVVGHYTLSEGRASETLGFRVAFNDLSPRQIAAGFVHWTRGFGDQLAHAAFEPHDVQPFDWSKPGNFYETVGQSIHRKVDAATAAHGDDLRRGENEVTGQFVREMLARPTKHLVTTTLFAYRGLWVDEFILIGFPLLLVLIWQTLQRWQWEMLILLSPGLYGMLFYSLFSLNIPRYQLTCVPTLALVTAIGVANFLGRRANVPAFSFKRASFSLPGWLSHTQSTSWQIAHSASVMPHGPGLLGAEAAQPQRRVDLIPA